MKIKLALVFSALVGIGFFAVPSPAVAQLKDRIEEMRKKQQAQQKEAQKESKTREAVARAKKGKGYAKGHDKK
jgi:hypothetical protein